MSHAATLSAKASKSKASAHNSEPAMRAGDHQPDFLLRFAVGTILTLGLVLVYSSSSAYGNRTFGDSGHFIKLQLMHVAVGLALAAVCARLSGQWLMKHAGWIFLGLVIVCIAVLIPGIGVYRGGARRWLALGPVGFQPSEIAKLGIVIVLAAVCGRREGRGDKERVSLLVPVLLAQVPVALVLMEPDLGTALVIELVLGAMVFIAGVSPRMLTILFLACLPVFNYLLFSTPFRLRRLLSYIDPWEYRSSVGYQVTESMISIGSGGVTGLGIGEGKHRLFFLPEAHTDFIFAILAQELGLVGSLLLLSAYALLIWRATRLATLATSSFDRYLAIGITTLIGVPAVFNTCVVTGLLPTKGLPLPLVSYGGSNLVITLAAIGLLLRIERDLHRDASQGGT